MPAQQEGGTPTLASSKNSGCSEINDCLLSFPSEKVHIRFEYDGLNTAY